MLFFGIIALISSLCSRLSCFLRIFFIRSTPLIWQAANQRMNVACPN
jgi:hypothetical protein